MGSTGMAQEKPPPPDPPEMDLVSVDTATQYVRIQWEPSSSPDIDKYLIYQDRWFSDGIYGFLIDSVDSYTLSYTHPTTEAGDTSLSYSVASSGSGFNPSIRSDFHSTMHLTTRYDSCEKIMQLNWTPYVGWEPTRYEVMVSIDDNPYSIVNPSGTQDTSILHYGIEDNKRYCYFVVAVRPGDADSHSNIACFNVRHPLHPQYINAEYASVSEENSVDLAFYIDPSGEVNDFQLFRASGPGKPFVELELFTDVSSNPITYTDTEIFTDRRSLYKLYSVDVCYNPVTESNVTGNIVLQGSMVGLQGLLSWNPYEEYEAGVKAYHIYRVTNDDETLAGSIGFTDTSYQDNLGDAIGSDIRDEVCYYVVAEENDHFTQGERGMSRSNDLCLSVVPEIIMANAFTPNGDTQNDKIRPNLTFIPEKYIFQVFDRWGSRIFETNNPDIWWDGTVNGNAKAAEGVYIYYIKLTTASGIEVEQKGHITLFYP